MSKQLKICIILLSFLSFACKSVTQSDKRNIEVGKPKFVVQPEIHNFGTLVSGEVVNFSFKYTNSGTGELKIDSVNGGCGCIDSYWSKNVLKQGESDFLKITFNSSGEWGNIYKPIVVYTNTLKNKKEIYISANVNNQLFK